MKENSSSGLSSPSAYTNWSTTEDEILVAEILQQLPTLILKRESLSGYKFPITWGSKRRRSAHENRPSLLCSSSSPPGALAVGSTSDADLPPPPTLKVEASSPATPLSFSPSESEDKPKPSRRKLHVKRKKEEWLETIDELTRRKELLKGEIKNVNRYYEDQKALNLKLKARKYQLTLGSKMEALSLGTDQSLNVNMEMGPATIIKSPSPTTDNGHLLRQEIHQPPSIVIMEDHVLAQTREMSENIQYNTANNQIPYSMVSSVGFVNNDKDSHVVPDLNLSVEEFNNVMDSAEVFHLDTAANKELLMNKVMAAQARRNRIQICRVKNSIARYR